MNDWKWFGHAAHLIVGSDCRFHLATLLPNGYMVSTVGEYWPDRIVREIHAEVHDRAWLAANRQLKGDSFDAAYMQRFGYQEIGFNRKYETMVFATDGTVCADNNCNCGLPSIAPSELDARGCNEAGEATRNHMELCAEWAAKEAA